MTKPNLCACGHEKEHHSKDGRTCNICTCSGFTPAVASPQVPDLSDKHRRQAIDALCHQIVNIAPAKTPQGERDKVFFEQLETVLDEQFPKGECMERGEALVLFADANILASQRIAASRLAALDSVAKGVGNIHKRIWVNYHDAEKWDYQQIATKPLNEVLALIENLKTK